MSAEPVTADDVLRALSVRHSEDVFVPECKDGPTQGRSGSHARLDAWAMRKSWSSPCMWGYEIKVSRSDFRSDDKWPNYLPLCNQLWFVAPKGLLKPEEMPGDIGLLELCGSRLLTRKKATHREIEPPVDLMQYVLQSRAKIDPPRDTSEQHASAWRRWLEEKDERRELGWRVSGKLAEHVKALEERVRQIERTPAGKVEAWAAENGVDLNGWHVAEDLTRLRKRTTAAIDPRLAPALRVLLSAAKSVMESLESEESHERRA